MKKLLLGIVIAAVLTGCSSDPEKLQTANDSYQKYAEDVPGFSPLNSGGVTLPRQSNLYELPAEIKKELR
ncbi:conserved domain protein [Haemophilus pittmaniae HK 85]|uniref:Type IV secretion system putative lipoprotein virB7 n=1 Tax=Haemophilus pittmaniae HK 85 TaxID=1035188 RepID=F9Q6W1_9PAST|nr:conserved domain protein [Haemophilus pittmaniae HK 85]